MIIFLYGGPCDGRSVEHCGSDTIQFAMEPPMVLDFSVPTVDPVRFNSHVYRRSLINPNIFVYQP
jgi:hypothetical protein